MGTQIVSALSGIDFSKAKEYELNKAQLKKIFYLLEKTKVESDLLGKIKGVFKSAIKDLEMINKHSETDYELIELKKKIKIYFSHRKTRPEIREKWHRLRNKVTERIARRATVPGARVLRDECWIEAIGIKLVKGDKICEANVHPDALKAYFKKWVKGGDEKGVQVEPYQSKYSFQDYLNKVVIPQLTEAEFLNLIKELKGVEYYPPHDLDTLEVFINQYAEICTKTPHLNEWIKKMKAENIEEEESYRTFLANSLARGALDSNPPQDGLYPLESSSIKGFIFVLTPENRFFIQTKQSGRAQHSSLGRGQPVLCAGTLMISKFKDPISRSFRNRISSITDLSGHYNPPGRSNVTQIISFLEHLKKMGVPIDETDLEINGKQGPLEIKRGKVEDWMTMERNELLDKLKRVDEERYHRAIRHNLPYAQIEELLSQ